MGSVGCFGQIENIKRQSLFSPDGVSTAYLYNDIALRLQQSGYVVVLTTTPHFNIVPEQVEKQPMRWKSTRPLFRIVV